MQHGLTLNGISYELVETDNANECIGCSFYKLCNEEDVLKSDTLPCYFLTAMDGEVISIGHHFERVE